MRILHLCLAAFYIEGMSYQENLLPQAHKKMGYDVSVLAGLKTFSKDGESTYDNTAGSYMNKYGMKVVRLEYRKPNYLWKTFKKYIGTGEALAEAAPDVIFIHGVQFADISIVVRYLKTHPNITVYVDNHADYSNSATNWVSKNILHRMIWKYYAHKIEPFTTRFYGVLPARVDFLIDLYGLPKDKVELLVMGADDELVNKAKEQNARSKIREKFHIKKDDFLIMTGGKIDSAKKQVLFLMDAVNKMEEDTIKLIVFGSVLPDLKESVQSRCSNKVQYIGWADSDETYNYFAAADLVCFPGRHSVFWEQVVGLGIPMVVKYWNGTTHVDLGGNVKFLYHDNADEIKSVLRQAIDEHENMLSIAQSDKKNKFLYSTIAKQAIRDVIEEKKGV